MAEGEFTRTFRVRWSAVNAIGQAGLSEYFRYVVETAWDWGAKVGLSISESEQLGLAWVIREAELDLHRPLYPNDIFDLIKDLLKHTTTHTRLLFAQRRQLHRALAEYLEQYESDPASFADLAHHWQAADDIPKAVHYLEKAGDHARELGDFESARRFFNASLELSS